MDLYIHKTQILTQLGSLSASLNHDQYVQLIKIALDLSKLAEEIAKMENPENSAAPKEPMPGINILGKSVEVEFNMVPFSSSQGGVDDPLNAVPTREKVHPFDLPTSSLKIKILPILGRISADGDVEIRSSIHLRTRNYTQRDDQIAPFPERNLNGANVMRVIKSPNLILTVKDELISVLVENEAIQLQNSIAADLAPFFEAPFPPDPAGGPEIKILVKNLELKLVPDLPTIYPDSFVADLDIVIEEILIKLNPNGSISILKNAQKTVNNGPVNNGPVNGTVQNRPQPPPRPSILTRTAICQTDHSSIELEQYSDTTDTALIELQVHFPFSKRILSNYYFFLEQIFFQLYSVNFNPCHFK